LSATVAAAAGDSRTMTVMERVLAARETRTPLRIRGAGTWMNAARPVAHDSMALSLADDRGIVEYVPGDLTLTARAGTPLSEIDAATRAHGQWLPLAPWGSDAGTIGATVSTATAGPWAHATGLPRDVVLGAEMVSGNGQLIRAGGRVVKNVAGFDLTRLVVGSWGTIAVITEVTVRLRARPEVTRTIAIDGPADAAKLNELAMKLRGLPFVPLGCELIHAQVASRLGLPANHVVLVRLGGTRRAVDAQVAVMRAIGGMSDASDDVWNPLRDLASAATAAWRWSRLPSAFGETWIAADRGTRALAAVLIHGSPMRGVVATTLMDDARTPAAEIARIATAFDGTVAIDMLSPEAWPDVRLRTAADPLSVAIRTKFDPDGILNRGILGLDS
jgi:glycolate oxidase FAD binding subunit